MVSRFKFLISSLMYSSCAGTDFGRLCSAHAHLRVAEMPHLDRDELKLLLCSLHPKVQVLLLARRSHSLQFRGVCSGHTTNALCDAICVPCRQWSRQPRSAGCRPK